MKTLFIFIFIIAIKYAVRHSRFHNPGFQSGVKMSYLYFSAVGTIHLRGWICGDVGFMRIVQMARSNNQIVRTYGTCHNQCPS